MALHRPAQKLRWLAAAPTHNLRPAASRLLRSAFLMLVLVFFISLLCCHKRVLPRLEKVRRLPNTVC